MCNCRSCLAAEIVSVAIIRWFEGFISWSGSVEDLWVEVQPFLLIPVGTTSEQTLLDVLESALVRKSTLFSAARIRGFLNLRQRSLTLEREGEKPQTSVTMVMGPLNAENVELVTTSVTEQLSQLSATDALDAAKQLLKPIISEDKNA